MDAPGRWMLAGWLLALSGLLHGAIQLIQPASWEGPVSWRKPILFGLSSALTAWSLAWVQWRVRPRAWDLAISTTGSVALLLEVALITLQAWRGVPSHFNHATRLDDLIQSAMGGLIVLVTLAVADLTWRCMVDFDDWPDLTDAARWGMALLLVSCLAGFATSWAGEWRLAKGLDPSAWGDAGVPKFPHGAAMHALQVLPLVAWMLNQAGFRVPFRRKAVAAMGITSVAWLGYALSQTLEGRGRLDPSPTGTIVLLSGIVTAGVTFLRR